MTLKEHIKWGIEADFANYFNRLPNQRFLNFLAAISTAFYSLGMALNVCTDPRNIFLSQSEEWNRYSKAFQLQHKKDELKARILNKEKYKNNTSAFGKAMYSYLLLQDEKDVAEKRKDKSLCNELDKKIKAALFNLKEVALLECGPSPDEIIESCIDEE